MECSEFLSRFSDFYDAPLESRLRRQVEAHLEQCERCARYERTVASGAALLQTLPRIELSESFRPTLEHRLFHLEDENALARAAGVGSGSAEGTVVGPQRAALRVFSDARTVPSRGSSPTNRIRLLSLLDWVLLSA